MTQAVSNEAQAHTNNSSGQRSWRIIKYSYLLLAAVCLSFGTALLGLVISIGLWLAIPVVLVLFFLSSFRVISLGWKTIVVSEHAIEFSAPFWFTIRVPRADLARCETVKTDSRIVESEAGNGFQAHTPRLAQAYRWARLLVRLAKWLGQMNRTFGASSSVPVGSTAAPLLAIRFWLIDGTRSEVHIPDDPRVTPELVARLAAIDASAA